MEPASVFSISNSEHLLMFRGGMPLYISATSADEKNTFEIITDFVGKGIKKLDKIRKIFIVTMDGIKALGVPVKKFTKLTPNLAKSLSFINYTFETIDFADKLSNCIKENPQSHGRCVVSSAGYMVGKICTEALGSAVTLSALSLPAYLSSPIGQVALITSGITISMKSDDVGEKIYNYILSSSSPQKNINIATETYNKHIESNSKSLQKLLSSFPLKKEITTPKSQTVVKKDLFSSDLDSVLQNITDISSFGAGVAAVLGDKGTARQIARVSNTLVTSSRLITSVVAGTINPLGAIGGILNLIAGLFDDDSSNLEGIINGINEISRQVNELFEFISVNFAEVHEHLHFQDRVAIMHFCKTTRDIENLRHNFATISREIRTASVSTITMLQEIGGQIKNLSTSYSNHEIAKISDEVETKIQTAMRKCEASPQNFVESAQTLQILIGQLCHAKYTKFKVNIPHPGFYISPEFLYSINCGDYFNKGGHIMRKHPHLYCSASLALIYITLCQYPDNNCDTMKTISRTDIERLKQVHTFGQQLSGYIQDLHKNLHIIENYSKEYRQLTNIILKHLREEYTKLRKDIQKQYEDRTQTSLSNTYYNIKEITAFKSQKIKVNIPVGEWFCGDLIHNGIDFRVLDDITTGNPIKKTLGNWFTYDELSSDRNTNWIRYGVWAHKRTEKITRKFYNQGCSILDNCYKQYFNYMNKQIESKIVKYVAIVDKKYHEKKLLFPAFIIPEEPNNPILPTGDKVEQLVKKEFGPSFVTTQTALKLTYKINEAQKKIIISIYFGSLKIMEVFSNNFDMLFYSNGEKVWYAWNGGMYPQTKETVRYNKNHINYYKRKSEEAETWGINLPKMPNKAIVPQFNLQVRKLPKFNHVIEELRVKNHRIDIDICSKSIDHVITKHCGIFDKLTELNKSFNVYMNIVASSAENIKKMPTDLHLMCIRMLKARKNKTIEEVCNYFQDKVYDKFAVSSSSRGSVETVVQLLDAVINFYGKNIVEFNNWYIDESEKIAEMRGNMKLVVSSLKYMNPGNIETFIRKEVEPQLRTLTEASRQRVVEEYKSVARESLSLEKSMQTTLCRLIK